MRLKDSIINIGARLNIGRRYMKELEIQQSGLPDVCLVKLNIYRENLKKLHLLYLKYLKTLKMIVFFIFKKLCSVLGIFFVSIVSVRLLLPF